MIELFHQKKYSQVIQEPSYQQDSWQATASRVAAQIFASNGRTTVVAAIIIFAATSLTTRNDCQAAVGKSSKRPAAGGHGVFLQSPESHTAIEHNNRGVELGIKGLWTDAIREHKEALEMDPYNKEFQTNLSAAYLRYGNSLLGRHDSYHAGIQFRQALYVDPANGPADEALDTCLKAVYKKSELDYVFRKNLAETADENQDYGTAVVEWRKCVKMRDDGPSHAGLGRCLLKIGQDKETVAGFAELRTAVAKTWEPKKDAELMRNLSQCHAQLGDILKDYAYKARDSGRGTVGMKRLHNAAIEYRRAITINPSNTDAQSGLKEVAREAVALNPSFDNHLMLGGAYLLNVDFEHAKMEYEECCKLDSRRPELSKAQKSYHLAVAKCPTATPAMLANTVEKVYKAVQKDPSDAEWWYVLGRAKETQYEKSGAAEDKDAALVSYQKAAAINKFINPDLEQGLRRLGGGTSEVAGATEPNAGKQKNSSGNTAAAQEHGDDSARHALAYAPIEKKLNSGDIGGAQQDLLALVDKNPKDGRAWLLLGNTYEKMSNPDLDQAIVAYRQSSLLKEPGAADALDGISTSRIAPLLQDADKNVKANNLVQAAASLREAISIAPSKAMLYRKLSEVLQKMGDKQEADKMMKKADKLEKEQTGSDQK